MLLNERELDLAQALLTLAELDCLPFEILLVESFHYDSGRDLDRLDHVDFILNIKKIHTAANEGWSLQISYIWPLNPHSV